MRACVLKTPRCKTTTDQKVHGSEPNLGSRELSELSTVTTRSLFVRSPLKLGGTPVLTERSLAENSGRLPNQPTCSSSVRSLTPLCRLCGWNFFLDMRCSHLFSTCLLHVFLTCMTFTCVPFWMNVNGYAPLTFIQMSPSKCTRYPFA